MTSVKHPPQPPSGPPAGHAVARFTAALSDALDRLADVPAWSMTPDEQREAMVELRRQRARLEELELRVLVSADRNQVGAKSGAASTPSWLAHETKSTRGKCFQELHLAKKLDADFEATRRALAAGEIDGTKAHIITTAVELLTDEYDDLPEGTHEVAEAHMIELARQFNAPQLRQLGKRLVEVICPEAADEAEGRTVAEENKRARRLAFLSLHDNGDGTTEGRFRLPTHHAHLLKKALQALTSPRRLGDGRLDPETGRKLSASTLLGLGFIDLLENHIDIDSMPTVNGSPFTLLITMGVDALRSGIGVATLETGHRISAGEARRLACKAGIIPMVLDGDSVPLDLGREQRLFDRYQKIAINHRYKGCAAHNCDRPPSWVEYHHEDPWHLGGRTDANKGVSLCPPHHYMADHPESFDMTRLPDGKVRFNRRT